MGDPIAGRTEKYGPVRCIAYTGNPAPDLGILPRHGCSSPEYLGGSAAARFFLPALQVCVIVPFSNRGKHRNHSFRFDLDRAFLVIPSSKGMRILRHDLKEIRSVHRSRCLGGNTLVNLFGTKNDQTLVRIIEINKDRIKVTDVF